MGLVNYNDLPNMIVDLEKVLQDVGGKRISDEDLWKILRQSEEVPNINNRYVSCLRESIQDVMAVYLVENFQIKLLYDGFPSLARPSLVRYENHDFAKTMVDVFQEVQDDNIAYRAMLSCVKNGLQKLDEQGLMENVINSFKIDYNGRDTTCYLGQSKTIISTEDEFWLMLTKQMCEIGLSNYVDEHLPNELAKAGRLDIAEEYCQNRNIDLPAECMNIAQRQVSQSAKL